MHNLRYYYKGNPFIILKNLFGDSSDFSVDTLRPLFGKEGIGEILRITNTTIWNTL
jgi:hypothetical protein